MKIVIVSGGTGGHIYPGIAIAQALNRYGSGQAFRGKVLFIGSSEGLEKDIIQKYRFPLKLIRARGMLRKLSYKAISAPFVSTIGFFQSLFILKEFKPSVVVSTGGYVSLPVVLAAKMLRIPVILQEQNALPGMVNKFCARFSDHNFLAFEQATQYLRGEVVGNPVRAEIVNRVNQQKARELLNLPQDKQVVLVVGGSQGAYKINELILSCLEKVDSSVFILHITGKRDFAWVTKKIGGVKFKNYRPVSYAENITLYLASADLVISRAGATALSEFAAVGLPMILIPFPYAAENHQFLNAKAMQETGVAILIEQKEATPQKMLGIINNSEAYYAKIKKAAEMVGKPDAAQQIVDYIYGTYR